MLVARFLILNQMSGGIVDKLNSLQKDVSKSSNLMGFIS